MTDADGHAPERLDSVLPRPWSAITATSWLLVIGAQTAISITSGNVGRPTFWIGPLGAMRPWPMWFVPVLAPLAVIVLIALANRHAWRASVVAAGWVTAIAVIDLFVSPAIAVMEFVVAAAAWLVVLATLAARPTRSEAPPLPLSS